MLKENIFYLACYFAAFLICFTCLIYTLLQKRTDKLQNKVYIAMVIIVTLNTISMIMSALSMPYFAESSVDRWFAYIGHYTYFLFHTALCPAFFFYVNCVTDGAWVRYTWRKRFLYSFFFILTEIAVILNPFFHWVYYFNSDCKFTRNWAENGIYIAAAIYFILAMVKLLFSWKAVNAKKRYAILYFFVIVIIGVFIQFINIKIKAELFAEALALMGIMLAVETEDDLVNVDTGFYNRKALKMDVNSYIANNKEFEIICIKITNADIIQKVTGSVNVDILADILSDYFKTIVPRYNIYQTNPETFVMTLMGESADGGETIARGISERFDQVWDCGMVDIMLNAVVMYVKVPSELNNTMDLFYMVDSVAPTNNGQKVFMGQDLKYIIRRGDIENAIVRGLDEDGFEVYYQPTYHLDGLKLYGAEALIRLNDSIMGKLNPDEFIPVAEHMGTIGAIDEFVLKEVCEFLEGGIPQKYGMECINVNLSVIQFLKPGFVERIRKIVDAYSIDKSWINFEITESIAASDYTILSKVVKDLKNYGFKFSMDDYGTGYSNMQSIFTIDFDVVKIDKSILWGAMKSEIGKIILDNSVRMIHQMGKKILVEGVEKKAQLEMLKEFCVDYLQGFYFSEPIPKNEFVEYLSQTEKQ